jgi:DNA-binding NarL/FixJ family response regulator
MIPITVMLVDDHALVRSAVRQALGADDIEVIGEASSADEALLLAPQLAPDVLLLDLNLPGTSGLGVLRELAPRLPKTKIVMLTISDDRRDLLDAVRNGAAGYLTKDLSPEALQRAVRGIRSGDLAMSRAMAADVIQHLATTTNRPTGADTRGDLPGVSRREEEVLAICRSAGDLAPDGRDPRRIAAQQAGCPQSRRGRASLSRRAGELEVLAQAAKDPLDLVAEADA